MTLSTMGVGGELFRSPRAWLRPLLAGVAMNYVVLGGLILLLGGLLPLEEHLRTGFVVLASVPPAVGVIPFTGFLEGDVEFSLMATLGCYMGAFVATPLVLYAFLGFGGGLQLSLLTTMVEVIILPLILSRALARTGVASRMEAFRGPLTNWSFFLIVYTVVGLNREVFLSQPLSLAPAAAITVTTTLLLGYAVERAGGLLRIEPGKVTSLVLLGTSKNAGFAAGLALTLLGRQAAIPSAIQTVFMLSQVILLDIRKRRKRPRP
jgi:BASS family bile acid:Na+ symporter